jgi:hypothetical protein
MWNEYFERKDRDDRRRADNARLDAVLLETARAGRESRKPAGGTLRVAAGHAMMRMGAWLVDEGKGSLPAHR